MTWRKVLAKMLPWAPRSERQAAIAAAQAERESSRAGAEHARAIEEQIKSFARANHYAEIIASDIIHGRGNGGA